MEEPLCFKFRFILTLILFTLFSSSTYSKPQYSSHCSSTVTESTPTVPPIRPTPSFFLPFGYCTGADRILGARTNATFSPPKSLTFEPKSILQTINPRILRLSVTIVLEEGGFGFQIRRLYRGPGVFSRSGRVIFQLDGFWDRSTGLACMVGTGNGQSKEGSSFELNAVLKMKYMDSSTIFSSVVSGVVESVDNMNGMNWFEPIRFLGFVDFGENYKFTQIDNATRLCKSVKVEEEVLGGSDSCGYVNWLSMQTFTLDYANDCGNHYCGPFDRKLTMKFKFMNFRKVKCLNDGKVRAYVSFSNSRYIETDKSLVAEGVWDHKKKRLCLVACRVMNVSGSLSGNNMDDCAIGLSLWFPSVFSIEKSTLVSGQVWSSRDKNDPEYFDMVSIANEGGRVGSFGLGIRYNYTQMARVNKYCVKDNRRKDEKRWYPGLKNIDDMRFVMSLTNAEGRSAQGIANLLFVGENIPNIHPSHRIPSSYITASNQSTWNVSYKIGYMFSNAVYANQDTDISAEGIYDSQTGVLCMVGCSHVDSIYDCEVLIDIQLAPLNPQKGEHLTGSIKSLRKNSDPLFFKPLVVTSFGIYKEQAAETVWLMDIEILMVLVSLSCLCIFIGLQLFHIKRNPDVLPSMSITMLAILTVGYMIPLLLNFEALFFKNRNQQNGLLRNVASLQVNDVLVSVITMVAFVLQFWLLQTAWSSRSAHENKTSLWIAERRTVVCCLPLYAVGLLIALIVHFMSHETRKKYLWGDLMSFAGLVLDNYLLPQFIFNIFLKSKEKCLTLTPSFYIGTTIVRAFPHIYDYIYNAYRAHHYVPRPDSSYIYARQDGDLYSSAWDIIIPCEELILSALIYLQQKFGGVSVVPKEVKEISGYEMVPLETHRKIIYWPKSRAKLKQVHISAGSWAQVACYMQLHVPPLSQSDFTCLFSSNFIYNQKSKIVRLSNTLFLLLPDPGS